MTRICFLVPTFNRARYIGEALDAILAQCDAADEVLVIDDGSTDGTADVVAAYAPRVRYVRQDNAGKGAAMNRGLALTQAEYLWVCDDDDVLLPGAVAALWQASNDGTLPIVFGDYQRFVDRGGERLVFSPGYHPDLTQGPIVRHVLEDLFVMQNATLVATGAVRAVGGFTRSLPRSVDYEFFVRLFASFPAHYVARDIFLQRQHDQARGPASALVPWASTNAAWRRFDRGIFERFVARVPLQFFEAMFDGPPAIVRRAALLQRATILARHDCWDLACDDWAEASAVDDTPLGPVERQICRRALSGKHGIGGLGRGDTTERLRRISSTPHGGHIVGAIMRGGLWRLKHGDVGTSTRLIRAILAIRPSLATGKSGPNHLIERSWASEGAFIPAGTLAPVELNDLEGSSSDAK